MHLRKLLLLLCIGGFWQRQKKTNTNLQSTDKVQEVLGERSRGLQHNQIQVKLRASVLRNSVASCVRKHQQNKRNEK